MQAATNAPRVYGVVFDGDDTLWSTEQLYDDARSASAKIVANAGFDASQWEELERRIDVENVARLGHSIVRFPTSCVQAYEELSRLDGRSPNPTIAEDIRRAAHAVFERRAPTMPKAREILESLRARGIRLALLTKGDRQVQERRLKLSGLAGLFDVTEIVEDKSPAAIRSVVARLGVSPDAAWMVGNSVRSDVLPALAAGLRVIWIAAHVWEYEQTLDYPDDHRVVEAATLAEVPDLVPV